MKISDFLNRKLARRFRTYDLNKDGYVERSDFEEAAKRMSDEFGLKSGDAARKRLNELCLGVWDHQLVAADSNGDGKLTESEYKAAFASGLLETPANFEQGYEPFLDAIMDIADSDRDGRLSRAEHVRWITSLMNVSTDDAQEIARRLDGDNDGFIERRDILKAIHDYYFDEAPQSAGSWLLGTL
ncbi:calcium-binding protein [Dyella sp. M7H15-1]|uniref:EF-hand domain-containing protein n=1 Tax=Dyella sp. M7H15-1 TaxID=2501295 RepID=UPI001004D7FF|nr:EF-hand domain-containing protein [Dyella sp. M7H15-1]QAU24149.1 calcium-binding protein [Dyella sp. M7H15-1]